jgi:type I restriction enzyme S subunit
MTETKILTHEERRQQFIESGWLVSIPLVTIPAHWLYRDENRLDGSFYAQEAATALRLINDSGYSHKTLEELTAPLHYPGRFKRVYAKSKKDGTPFLTASEMLQFRPDSQEYLANNNNSALYRVPEDLILVTRSGTVGRCTIVGKRLSTFAITDDAIRVKVEKLPTGYIYAFLSSWIGQALISKDQYGSAIKHLEPHHLAKVPIPFLPETVQNEIHAEIMRAFSLRDKANQLLDEADQLLHKQLDLPCFDENLVQYLPAPKKLNIIRDNMPHPKAFSLKASNLQERFDASFHVPMAQTAVNSLKKGKYAPTQLTNFAKRIFIPTRFKRIYVPKEYGVPFLQGSHLPQTRPYDLKFLSLKANSKHISECLIHSGYVLVTRSGTIGRIGLVTSSKDNWGASEHILRIVPDDEKAHSGFIAAFLMTPYGQHQLKSKIYGGVVDEITEEDTGKIWIPNAPEKIQTQIGELVKSAFEKKDEASKIEEAAIAKVENLLNAVRS